MKDEMKAVNAYQMIMQVLTDSIKNADHEIKKKTALRAVTEQAKAGAEAYLVETNKERDEDQAYLDVTTALRQQKTSDFETRRKLRAEELETLKKAIEIISSKEVTGAGDKYLPTLVQVGSKPLAQAQRKEQNPLQLKVVVCLTERARATGSRVLSEVSEQVAAF